MAGLRFRGLRFDVQGQVAVVEARLLVRKHAMAMLWLRAEGLGFRGGSVISSYRLY